jgi:hypothetical protein
MSKWHVNSIKKGKLGELSKIAEELEEAIDAEQQGQDLMLMFELSDICGACGKVAEKYGFNLKQLVKFSKLRSKVAETQNEKKSKRKNRKSG